MHNKIITILASVILLSFMFPAALNSAIIRKTKKAQCKDTATGVWEGLVYSPTQKDWYFYTLTIRRPNPRTAQLRGKITSQSWFGAANDKRKYTCGHRNFFTFVTMKARGSIRGDLIEFKAYGRPRIKCENPRYSNGYNPDSFHGKIDFKEHIIYAMNNDGEMAVNKKVKFIQVRCID